MSFMLKTSIKNLLILCCLIAFHGLFLFSSENANAKSLEDQLQELHQAYAEALTLPETEQKPKLMQIAKVYQHQVSDAIAPSALLYYNLGTIFLKCEHYGQAIYYLQKAYHLNPNDQRIVDHLHRATLQAKIPSPEQNDLSLGLWLQRFWSSCSVKVLQILLIFFSLASGIYFFYQGKQRPKVFFPLGIIFCLGLTAIVLREREIGLEKEVVLLVKQNPRSGLGPQYPGILAESTTLPAGSMGKLIREESGWYEVQWNEKSRGWVTKSEAGVIP